MLCCLLAAAAGDGAGADGIFWARRVSVGFTGTAGNSDTVQISGDFLLNRNNRWVDEYTFRGILFYSTSFGAVDARKSVFLARYAFSFGAGPHKKWYAFVKGEADYDEFADIDSRYIAGPGVGYWLSDQASLKAMAEISAAGERTSFVPQVAPRVAAILSPRILFETQVWQAVRFAEELTVYAAADRYRVNSQTYIVNAISDRVAAKLTIYDDYNSSPKTNVKKNDVRTVFSLQYSFP